MRTRFLPLVLLAACSAGSSSQVLTGRVAPGFPTTITEVKAMHAGGVIATSPVAADGSFRLVVPPSTNVSIRFVGASYASLVMPRQQGSLDSAFTIRAGGAPFALGAIHFVGDSSTTTFSFHSAGSSDECDDDDHDANGATCIVDDDGEDDDSCEAADNESETEDSLTSAGADDADGEDDGDAVPENDFPESGCSGSGSGSSGSGSGNGAA